MIITQKNFNIFVVVPVILTGAGFSVWAGLAYDLGYWWGTAIPGTVISYPLARLYLKQLKNISAKRYSRKKVWLLSTGVAVICGIICTTFAHGFMALLIVHNSDVSITNQYGLWPIVIVVSEIIGALAGLLVGGICSLVYVLSVNDNSNETVYLHT